MSVERLRGLPAGLVLFAALTVSILLPGCARQPPPPPAATADDSGPAPDRDAPADAPHEAGRPQAAATPQAPGTPEEQVRAAVDDAIRSLESQDFVRFLEYYIPVDDLRSMREYGSVAESAAMAKQHPESVSEILEILRSVQGKSPRFDDSNSVAIFEAETADLPAPPPVEPPVFDVAAVEVVGFGEDLDAVLAKAIVTLEAGDLPTFIEAMFPAGEYAWRAQDGDWVQDFADRMQAAPEALEAMLADLKALQDLTPTMEDNGQVAVFEIEGQTITVGRSTVDLPDRTVRLQKAQGSWRLFDNSAVRDELAEFATAEPPWAASRSVIVFERFGDNWRIAEFPR